MGMWCWLVGRSVQAVNHSGGHQVVWTTKLLGQQGQGLMNSVQNSMAPRITAGACS